MKIFELFLPRLLELVKSPKRALLAVVILVGTIYFIKSGDNYISVPGNLIKFQLPQFRECRLTFRAPVTVTFYTVSRTDGKKEDSAETSPSTFSRTVECATTSLDIVNGLEQNTTGRANDAVLFIIIGSRDTLSSDILGVTVDGAPLSLESFLPKLLKNNCELVKDKRIRIPLANLISYFNDTVSNWILTAMCIGIAVFIPILAMMEGKLIFFSRENLENSLVKSLQIKNSNDAGACREAFARYAAHWYVSHGWFGFFQTLGPAMGFLLTVSSLIAALNPSVHASNDLNGFMTGIHVAMVSTFVGLLLRLLAIEASRVNDVLLSKVEMILVTRFSGK